MKALLSTLAIFISLPFCYSQSRQLSIKIIDSATSEPLPSVGVKLVNTGYANVTDKNGKCEIDSRMMKGDTLCFLINAFYATRRFCILSNNNYSAEIVFRIPYNNYSRKGNMK